MIQLLVDNSYSRIIGLTDNQLGKFRRHFSYQDDSNFRHTGRVNIKYAMTKAGVFGTGLLPEIVKILEGVGAAYELQDNRQRPETGQQILRVINPLPTPYPEQQAAVDGLVKRDRGIVVLPTGVGKSLVQIMAIKALEVPTLIITPNLNLKNSMYDDLCAAFGRKYVNMAEKGKKNKFITVANIQSLESMPDNVFDDKELLLLDEFHHSCAKSYKTANRKKFKNIYYRMCLTATPYRNDRREDLFLRAVVSDYLVELDISSAITSGYIVRPEFYCVKVEHTREEIDEAERQDRYHDIRKVLVNESESFHNRLSDVIKECRSQGLRTLVLLDQTQMIPHITSRLSGLDYQVVTGDTEDNHRVIDQFNMENIDLLIGSPVISEGTNTKPVEALIIASPDKSKPAFIQRVGRGLRNYPGKHSCKIYFFDLHKHPIFSKQTLYRLEYCKDFKQYGEVKFT